MWLPVSHGVAQAWFDPRHVGPAYGTTPAFQITMLMLLLVSAVVFAVGLLSLAVIRVVHERHTMRIWETVREPAANTTFDAGHLAELPSPARRFLEHAIRPGTPLARSVELETIGAIGLHRDRPKLPFRSRQVLSRQGLVWKARVGSGLFRMSGADMFDGRSGSMRWHLWGLAPVVSGGGPDVSRSAAGRVALELVSYLPTALLPQAGVRWEAVDDRTARAHLTVAGEQLSPLVTVAADGRLERVEMLRWDDGGKDSAPGYVLWAGECLDGEQTFDGVTLPRSGRVTKWAGTPQAHQFFDWTISRATFR
jgi:hypothetical protein